MHESPSEALAWSSTDMRTSSSEEEASNTKACQQTGSHASVTVMLDLRYTPKVQSQTEKKMEHDMATRVISGLHTD